MSLQAAAAWLLLQTGSGCLVTEPWSPPEKANVPPIIQADPSSPNSPKIGSIVWLNSEDPTMREWEFAVVVIEEDETRELEARYRIVKQNDPSPAYTSLTLEAGLRVRPVKIKVASSQLTYNECHHLELAVSGSFVGRIRNADPRLLFESTTKYPDEDLALASWWIWAGQGSSTLADAKVRVLDSCRVENVPTSSVAMPEVQ